MSGKLAHSLLVLCLAVEAALQVACSNAVEAGGVPGAAGMTSDAGGNVSAGLGGEAGSRAGSSSAAGAVLGGTASIGGGANGASGTVGLGGSSSANGGGSGGVSGGAGPASPSPGCGLAAPQALGSWVERPKLSVNTKDRQWWVWLPANYDPNRAYPLVFTFHGCGGPDNILPMQKATGDAAILVRGTGITGGCWTYGANGEDVSFFDALLTAVEAQYCVDSSRVFATGYSSGAWLVNTLSCARGDKLRGAGTVSGGVVGGRGACKGQHARIFLHDQDDTTNRYVENGNRAELARVTEQNHCTPNTLPVPEAPAPCARYQGCDSGYPVISCLTENKQHDRQDSLALEAFWGLFSSL